MTTKEVGIYNVRHRFGEEFSRSVIRAEYFVITVFVKNGNR